MYRFLTGIIGQNKFFALGDPDAGGQLFEHLYIICTILLGRFALS